MAARLEVTLFWSGEKILQGQEKVRDFIWRFGRKVRENWNDN